MFLVLGFWPLLPGPALAAVTFTGLATRDFQSDSCLADPGGRDVGMPSAFPDTEISGWDIEAVCLSYDPAADILYIGIQTFDDASNVPIIFGDADGDGFEDSAGLVLQTLLGEDRGDLEGGEFFTLALDFNNDDVADLVAGTHNENGLSAFGIRDGAAPPDHNLLLAPLARFYGAALPATLSVNLGFFPDRDHPHLEFAVTGLSTLPEYSALDFSDPDSFFRLYITTGSFDDDGIAEEYFPNVAAWRSLQVEALGDFDGDTVNDAFDRDDDNDTLSDLIEKNLAVFDADGDGLLSEDEALASELDLNADGDIDLNDVGRWPDADGDGTPDYLDADSDNDGIADADEAAALAAAEGEGTSAGLRPVVAFSAGAEADESSGDSAPARLGGDVDLTRGPVRLQGASCGVAAGPFSAQMFFVWLFLICYFGLSPKAWALRADHFDDRTETAQTLAPKKFFAGLTQFLTHAPLGFGLTSTGQSLDNVVNYFYVWDVWGAIGLFENWEAGLRVPAALAAQVEDLNSSVERNTSAMGDIRLQAKWRPLSWFAILTYLDLPTGEAGDFFGEANVTGGFKLLAEQSWKRHTFAGHLGFLGRGPETVAASNITLLKVYPEMLWGAYYAYDLSRNWLGLTHLWGSSDFRSEATTPVEWDFGFQKGLERLPMAFSFGFGFGLTPGYGVPTYRLLLGLKYFSSL
ncbi:MAG: hypothetical protein HY466_07170 [Deltaproteobacteria bacterium]|nr:hypothetical protein [Deltaproteobacteria bacterium]